MRLTKITNVAIGKNPRHIPAKSGGLKVISDVTQNIRYNKSQYAGDVQFQLKIREVNIPSAEDNDFHASARVPLRSACFDREKLESVFCIQERVAK